MDDSFTATAVSDVKDEVLAFANNQLLAVQLRDDYKELLEITILFLGGTPSRGFHFMAPAGMHRARWMATAIYAIKLWMFYGQFPLTKKEDSGLRDAATFVVYLKAWYTAMVYRHGIPPWYTAPIPTSASRNDLKIGLIMRIIAVQKK